MLGVCLGVQLLARAAGAQVRRLAEPEIGWIDVELNDAGVADPVLGVDAAPLPRRSCGTTTRTTCPTGAVELARTDRTTQAFRLGDACWGVQFHPEVTALQLERWIADFEDPPPDPDGLRAETPQHIGAWNELGRDALRGVPRRASNELRARRRSRRD